MGCETSVTKVRQLFCEHCFLKTISKRSERVGLHNYVYDYDFYKCEKCGYSCTVKTLDRIEKNFYQK